MRRLLALGAALVLLAALPLTTQAARPIRETDHSIGLGCEAISSTAGGDLAYIGVSMSDTYGSDAYLDYWADGTPDAIPDLSRNHSQPVSLTLANGSLSGSFAVVDENGDPAGVATINAVLTPAGDPVPISGEFRFGNRWERHEGISQPLAITGTLQVDGRTFDLSQCLADESTTTFFGTNPNAFTARFATRSVGCDLTNDAGDTGFLFVDLLPDMVFIDAALTSANGSVQVAANGELPQSGGAVSGTLWLYDPQTFEPIDGQATIELSFSATERFRYMLQNAQFRRVVSGDLLDIEGTLTFPGGYTFDLGACVGVDGTSKSIDTFPKGPKPGGRVPANDTPSGATSLRIGGKTTTNTRAASPTAEEVFACAVMIDFETGQELVVPVGNTVWYTVTGTGGPITIDTSGSDFDTVVAVYSGSPGSLEPVACVDDVLLDPIGRSLQAAVTFESTAGVTYYVQVGGFPEAFPYGNLRVAVR